MSLSVTTSHASLAGPRERNEDFVGMVTPTDPELSTKGLMAAVADGVSGNEGGREASEYTVRGLLADYYATPDTWEISTALERVVSAINSWVLSQGAARREMAGMATTLTALVLRGRMYYTAHVGDSRCYLLRNGTLQRLTQDHVWERPEMRHVLTRAIGLDSRIAIDHGMGEMQVGDLFLLASDGVWAALSEYDITALLSDVARGQQPAQDAAQALCERALAAGSQDNASAIVLRVDQVPQGDLRDLLSQERHLHVPPRLKPGQMIDHYLVEEVIHVSPASLLYRVRDTHGGRQLVLKTITPERADDPQECSAFTHEEWLAKRVVARFFPQVITPQQKSYLYYLTTWHAGSTLQQLLDAGIHFTVPEAIAHGTQLVRAIGALHRRSIIHRDIKPANTHVGDDKQLRVLDMGVAQSGLKAESANATQQAAMAGTPSFLAPEQFEAKAASRQTDLYAAGVTLYYLLTRRYPYGEIEPFQHPRFGTPVPPTRYRPDIPWWLENVLLKAVARDPADRFETAEEFLLALERGASRPLAAPAPTPLVRRDPVSLWRTVAIVSLVLNLLLLYLIAVR
ncbi:protein kinase [Undibacterium arcticum]|uniref:Protein kinase n=2 Tax=Undibacterium arcticum TaxID=1762892 RepID=A0ABV7EVZ0_9BURK